MGAVTRGCSMSSSSAGDKSAMAELFIGVILAVMGVVMGRGGTLLSLLSAGNKSAMAESIVGAVWECTGCPVGVRLVAFVSPALQVQWGVQHAGNRRLETLCSSG